LKGLSKLGIDSITNEEAKIIFRYLDYEDKGDIGLEEFKDIMHEERPPKAEK
jgi:Ca2+-binding EF-hand superfamily protein